MQWDSHCSRGLITCQSDTPSAFKGRNPLDSTPDPGHKGRVRSRTAKCVRRNWEKFSQFHSAVTPDANREHLDQGCAAIALVRVIRPTDTLP
ncbi:hypothetical protein ABIF63_006127 [Bradyrhizobium japonicum]|uniref:Uncharacterized protein n=1 Tax=Bradyrhizobium japonicum TaxID=375 RepID=A0ABV2RYM7_BRAJP